MPAKNPIFRIEEVEQRGLAKFSVKRTFEWSAENHSAPVGEVDLSLVLKHQHKNLPGTEQPVSQVLASDIEPFDIEGVWSDSWTEQGFARQTWKDFFATVRRGNLIRITFDGIVIVGLVTKFTGSIRSSDIVPWSATIKPHKVDGLFANTLAREIQNVFVAKALKDRSSAHYRAVMEHIEDEMLGLHDETPRNPMAGYGYEGVTSQLELFKAQRKLLETVAVDNEVNAARSAVQSFRREASVHRQIRGEAQKTLNATIGLRADVDGAWDDGVSILQHEAWTRGMRRLARLAIFRSYEAERDFDELADGEPVGRYLPKKGETVYMVSDLFYGTPNEWERIHEANNLFKMRFDGTEELVIPKLEGVGV